MSNKTKSKKHTQKQKHVKKRVNTVQYCTITSMQSIVSIV